MGNNGSNSRERGEQQTASEATRGWSQSFPRELARHRGQPSAVRKVLPEPPNQRLRATDNGNIIHNGGTISGRRPTVSCSRDLAKRNESLPPPLPPTSSSSSFRERSGSASNLVESRSRRIDRHCCRYRADSSANSSSGTKLKRFDSEPDLRCSPEPARPSSTTHQDRSSPAGHSIAVREDVGCHRVHGRESKERLESRYKPRKKYKAPAPPTSACPPADRPEDSLAGGEPHPRLDDRHQHRHRQQHQQLQPPPRRSRLFKTRAESKKAQVSWQLSSAREPSRTVEQSLDSANRWNDAPCSDTGPRPDNGVGTAVDAAIGHHQRRSKLPDRGKNTLQRSMSSPEFQAELIQVAKRVRDKLESSGNLAIGESTQARRTDRFDADATGHARAHYQRCETEDTRKNQKVERPRRDLEIEAVGGADRRRRLHGNENEKRNSVAECPPSEGRFGRGDAADKENSDPGRWNEHSRRKWPDVVVSAEKPDARSRSNGCIADGINNLPFVDRVEREDQQPAQPFTSTAAHSTTPKTFYFGMNECPNGESRNDGDQDAERNFEAKSKFREREMGRSSVDPADDIDDNEKSVVENISLKLRPTLPKKQLEIPRFSPSAAWRLLSALEAPGPSMSTASEEMPVMFEERIERLSRPPPAFPVSLGPRSWHDKSGDSGISGDAGAGNEDSLDVSTINRVKTTATRPSWTPQQDLGEESSSDAGVDSPPPPPLPTPFKYHPPRAHVFSLSLPRDDARAYLCGADTKSREGSTFNSLQKLKRSVSGAFGIGSHDSQRKCTRDVIDDNWLLSSSAPTSLQHNPVRGDATRISPSVWRPFSGHDSVDRREQRVIDDDGDDGDDDDDDEDDDQVHDHDDGDDGDNDDDDDDDDDEEEEDDDNLTGDKDEEKGPRKNDSSDRGEGEETNDFPAIMKPPSFSYLTPGGHVMYLPETNDAEHRVQNLTGRKVVSIGYEGTTTIREQSTTKQARLSRAPFGSAGYDNADDDDDDEDGDCDDDDDDEDEGVTKERCNELFSSRPKSCDSADQRVSLAETRSTKRNSKSRRFTFQSTVRQIERRRLAEKLSREVEARERQRKGELEAMRKVEEEFQRKRAKEKANIRQQLRLFKEMEENFNNSIPTPDWDASQTSRADPDGAPSSAASSPTSLPPGNLSTPGGKPSSEEPEFRRKKHHESNSKQRHRPKYYDWSPDTSSHLDHKQTTVHPKIVCDIPKSSPVFVDVNVHPGNSTPRSDNYRKDFAHGTVIARTSFASSDSELSQPNTRPHSRQTGIKGKSHRSRCGSPRRSEDAATSEEDSPPLVEPTKCPRNPTHDFILSGVQPFTKQKAYRPISFNPRPPPSIPT